MELRGGGLLPRSGLFGSIIRDVNCKQACNTRKCFMSGPRDKGACVYQPGHTDLDEF